MFFAREIKKNKMQDEAFKNFAKLQVKCYFELTTNMSEKESKLRADKAIDNIDLHQSLISRVEDYSFMFQESMVRTIHSKLFKMSLLQRYNTITIMQDNLLDNTKFIKQKYGFSINPENSLNIIKSIVRHECKHAGNLERAIDDLYPSVNRETSQHSLNYYLESIILDIEDKAFKSGLEVISDMLKLNREMENIKYFKQIKNAMFNAVVEDRESELFKNNNFRKTILKIAENGVKKKLTTLKVFKEQDKPVKNKKQRIRIK